MVLLITERDVQSLLTMDMALEAVEEAFRGLADGTAINLSRRRIAMQGGVFHLMASAVASSQAFGLKAYPTFGGRVNFLIPFYDLRTGQMLALIEGDWLGRMRTGAASGVATRHMARPGSKTLGLFGTGGQARTQLLAICAAAKRVERVHVYSRDAHNRAGFVKAMQPQVTAQIISVEEPRAAVDGMDIIATMTTASQPLFDGAWLSPGTHINAAGSNHLKRRELDSRTVQRAARIAADSVEQARLEAGDLASAVAEGAITWDSVIEFAEIAGGRVPGRDSADDITESQVMAVWDVATAARVYALAKERGLGQPIPLFEE